MCDTIIGVRQPPVQQDFHLAVDSNSLGSGLDDIPTGHSHMGLELRTYSIVFGSGKRSNGAVDQWTRFGKRALWTTILHYSRFLWL